jgi:hypothetical protein
MMNIILTSQIYRSLSIVTVYFFVFAISNLLFSAFIFLIFLFNYDLIIPHYEVVLSFVSFSNMSFNEDNNSKIKDAFNEIKKVLNESIKGLDRNKNNSAYLNAHNKLMKEHSIIRKLMNEFLLDGEIELSKEQKLQARKEKAQNKIKLYDSSLYSKICYILGYDINQKIKEAKLHNKWISKKPKTQIEINDFNPSYFTYDLECYLNEQKTFVPYQFGLYHPDISYKSFYGKNCVFDALQFILNSKYKTNEVVFYAHNAGKFDALFLLKVLTSKFNIQKINTLKDKNNSIFSYDFLYNDIKFKFKDSFKLLPFGLDKLLKAFNINVDGLVGKLPFDHSWIN